MRRCYNPVTYYANDARLQAFPIKDCPTITTKGKTSMNYAGIDYGLGQSNIDKETEIRYGVISQQSVMPECLDDVEYNYGEPSCPECGSPAVASDDDSVAECDWNEGKDYACASCEICFWSEAAYPDEPLGFTYDKDGYQLEDCLDTDIFVLKSPYYTYAQFCSPCVPGAGNLDNPVEEGEGAKCYCLGHDWFEGGKAPYTVYQVGSDSIVEPTQSC